MRYLLMTFLLLSGIVNADSLGRFFLTPQERTQLEALRQHKDISATPGHPASATITLNGLVQRAQGKTTVWVNGTPQREGDPQRSVVVFIAKATAEHIPLKLPNSGRIVVLKAGQTVTVPNGDIRDAYQHPLPLDSSAHSDKTPAAMNGQDKG